MNASTRAMLNESEQQLIRETEGKALTKLDEDELIGLHIRIRRARNKYTKMHRRRGAEQVRKDKSRTRANAANERTAVKAEAFEDALSRVSAQLAKVSKAEAEALKAERLAAAKAAKSGGPKRQSAGSGNKTKPGAKQARKPAPIDKKRNASTKSAGKRSQARRDSR
jgi:hypothetical protein